MFSLASLLNTYLSKRGRAVSVPQIYQKNRWWFSFASWLFILLLPALLLLNCGGGSGGGGDGSTPLAETVMEALPPLLQ